MRILWLFLLVSGPALGADGLLVLDLQHDAADEQIARLIGDVIASSAEKRTDYVVTTGADLRKIADLETQKQAMGCDADASCLSEIADALGAKYVLHGSIGRLGGSYLVTMNVYDALRSLSVGRQTVQVEAAAQLPAAIEKSVAELLSTKKVSAEEQAPLFWPAVAAIGTGTLLAVGGAAVAAMAELTLADRSANGKEDARNQGIAALVASGVGALLTVAGVAAMMATGDEP